MKLREYIMKNEVGFPAQYAASENWENLIDREAQEDIFEPREENGS